MDNDRIISGVMGGGLRALNRIADSSWVERFGLEERTQQLVFQGARRVAATAAKAAKRRSAKRPGRSSDESAKFDLRLTEEQQLMRDTLRRFADEAMVPAARESDDAQKPAAEVLEAFLELGAIPLAVPEALGGAAERASAVSHMLVVEDLARGDMGLAYALLAPLSFVNAIVAWGDERQREAFLPRFLDGDAPHATVAAVEPHPFFDPLALRTVAKKSGSHFVLSGEKSAVALAETASLFLVAADVPKLGPRFFIVDRDARGVATVPEPAMGLRSAGLGRVTFDRVKVAEEAVLGGASALDRSGIRAYRDAVHRGRVAWGAMAVGAAQAVLDYVIPYCNDRVAFGEPISHRQAVAFMIADIAIELESMRMLVYRAAGRIDAGLGCARESYLARTLCADKAVEVGTNGVQLLGGAGFIKDHPIERWYRHLRAVGVMDGNLVV